MLQCPHCNQAVFKSANGGEKLKARTTILVLHKSGEVEINCGVCGQAIYIPLELKKGGPLELRKAEPVTPPKLVVRRA